MSSSGEDDDSLQVSDMLSDVTTTHPTTPRRRRALTGGGESSKLYLVASDGECTCLCSRDLSEVFLDDNLPVIMLDTFAAPPADINTV